MTFKELLHGSHEPVGTYIAEFIGPHLGPVLSSAGADFGMIDMEHSGFTYETVKSGLRHLHDAGVASLVRPPSRTYDHISRALDVGAQALMPPMVGSAEEARRILGYMKYPPDGERGVILNVAHDGYVPGPPHEKLANANAMTAFVPLIETPEGIADIDAIAAIDGVDCLWIGHFDLSCRMGIPAQFDHPEFQAAVDKVLAAGAANGKRVGRMVGSVDEAVALRAMGFSAFMYSGDIFLYQAALADGIGQVRARFADD